MMSPQGQHIELGIAENNLFILLAALGLSHSLFGVAPAADRHALRPLHHARPRCPQLRLLPGRALPAGGDAVGHHAGAGGRRPSVRRHAADRPGAGRPRGLRAGLRRRARDHHGLVVRLPAARRQRPGRRQPMVPRRQGRLGLSAPVHAHARAAGAQHRRRGARRHHRRRLLAAAAGTRRPARARLHRRHRPRGDRGAPPDPRGDPRRRPARRDLGRPPERRLARRRARPPDRPSRLDGACRETAGAAGARCRPRHAHRRPPGHAVLARRRARPPRAARSASSISASPATCPTSTATTVSTSTPSSTPARRCSSAAPTSTDPCLVAPSRRAQGRRDLPQPMRGKSRSCF